MTEIIEFEMIERLKRIQLLIIDLHMYINRINMIKKLFYALIFMVISFIFGYLYPK
jgi:hypothetical protein